MNIINIINYQLSKIEHLLMSDLDNKSLIYNYFICEESCKFLDKYALQSYITKTKIKNYTFLKSINQRCINILQLWNNDFINIPEKKLKPPFVFANIEQGKLLNTQLDFHAIYLTNNKFHFSTTETGKLEFIKNYSYNIYSIQEIAERCVVILNWITASCPETDQVEKSRKEKKLKEKTKKLPEKWYALLYWIELNANGKQPPMNSEGSFIRSEIETIGKEKTGRKGQGFYRSFIGIADDLNNERILNNEFPNWKQTIIALSNNDETTIKYIQDKYTS